MRPLRLADASQLRPALIAMSTVIVLMTAIGSARGRFTRRDGILLVALYPIFVSVVLLS